MSSGSTAQDGAWKDRESAAESKYAREKEQAQIAALRDKMKENQSANSNEKDFESGFGGQEDLEDRYATTSGEH